MRSLTIGLTKSSAERIIFDRFKYTTALEKILQHRILISDTLLEMYRSYFEEIDELMLFEKWFEDLNRIDKFEYVDSIIDKNEIIVQMKNIYKNIVVSKEKIEHENITSIPLDELNDKSINTDLDWYCIPFSKIIRRNTNNSVFFDWLKDLLCNETKITIIDPYICKDTNKNMFINLLMPSIPSNSKVAIYFDGREAKQSDISNFKNLYGDRLKMYPSSFRSDGHDRYIFCKSFVLNIGVGLDVFQTSTNKTRKETNISLTNGDRPTLPEPYR